MRRASRQMADAQRCNQSWIWALCHSTDPDWLALKKYRSCVRLAAQLTEANWNSMVRILCRSGEKSAPVVKKRVKVIGNANLPDDVEQLLAKGPKFCIPSHVPAHDLIAINRNIASKAKQDSRDQCLLEGVVSLEKSVPKGPPRHSDRCVRRALSFLRANDLCLMQADKEGGFVVVEKGIFSEKALQAVSKNFAPVGKREVRVKTKFVDFCKKLELTLLAKSIQNSRGNSLTVFFTAKTHKTEVPFRTIVSEKGCWQHKVSLFLQEKLKSLVYNDPFRTKNADDVVHFLSKNTDVGYGFSVDIEDLFYSVPQHELMSSVQACIEAYGAVPFQNFAGVSLSNFLSLLEFYLKVTFIVFNDQPYLQRNGICIGSCLAPLLVDIFLANVDCSLSIGFSARKIVKVFRYVDDFLVLLSIDSSYQDSVTKILGDFSREGRGLVFTFELPQDGVLQFLELRLEFCERHVCWSYHPRANKDLLPFKSAHSKIVKRGIAMAAMETALRKSCTHKMHDSFANQISRLLAAGFPRSLLIAVAETLFQKKKTAKRADAVQDKARPVVVPYMHGISHQLKKVAGRHGVAMALSAPNKLSKLCSRTCGMNRGGCKIRHGVTYVPCAVGVVYAIPLSCGRFYVGKTGRCINERLREHAQKVNKNEDKGAHLVAHINSCCNCEPRFEGTSILGRSNNEHALLALEAYHIRKRAQLCISDTSLTLLPSEFQFISSRM